MNIEDSFLGKPVGIALETLDIDAGELEQYVYAISLQNRLTEESVQGLNSLIETIKSAGAKLSDILELPIAELNKVVEKVKKSRKKRVVAFGAVFVTAIGITSAQAEGIDFDKIIDG
jgi:t-SNARE complex subunit (syntaxin)